MQQKIILIGPWNVWRKFIEQILKYDSISCKRHNNPTVIMWIVAHDSYIFNPHWLKDDILENVVSTRKLWESAIKINWINEILKVVDDAWLNWEIIFIDATAAKDKIKDFHLSVIEESDNKIVTANKNPISLYDHETYKRLTKNLRYQYTTTVMAGAWIVRFLRWTRKISDTIHSLDWMFSW
jgi:homoserine dehydrogenase